MTEIAEPVAAPSWFAAVMTSVPPLIAMSPESPAELSAVSTKVPLPVLVKPLVPAKVEPMVARFVPLPLLLTAMTGPFEPVGAANVSVLPDRVYPPTPKFRPPIVIGWPSATVPAVPVK